MSAEVKTSGSTSTPVARPDAPTAFITGDRLCTSCGYNLVGQAIVREPHYALLIARCPECGTCAAVQEYPLLGRWAHRWAMALAAIWMLLIVGAFVGTSGMMMGLALGASETAAEPYSYFIQNVFSEVERQAARQATEAPSDANSSLSPGTVIINRPGGAQQITTVGGLLGNSVSFQKWWSAQDKAAMLGQAGGWRSGLTPESIAIWVFSVLAMLAIGWFWAAMLVQLSRRGLLVWGGAVLILAAGFAAVPALDAMTREPSWGWMAGRTQLMPPFLGFSMILYFAGLAIGLVTGRPVVRFMIRMLLPPRMRYSLAVLWTCDGRALPPAA